jgi:hypothetical protein
MGRRRFSRYLPMSCIDIWFQWRIQPFIGTISRLWHITTAGIARYEKAFPTLLRYTSAG